MNQIDTRACVALAEQMFEELAAQIGGPEASAHPKAYFAHCAPGKPPASYLSKVPRMQASRRGLKESAGAGGLDQVSALSALWEQQQDYLLLSLAPSLRELAKSIARCSEKDSDSEISIFCYTLY